MPITIETQIRIQAPPEMVWHVLTDTARYPEWNPFITEMSGDLREGGRLRLRILRPDKARPLTLRPKVSSLRPNKELRWKRRLLAPGLSDGEHWFRLAPTHYGTLLEQGERFSGVFASDAQAQSVREGFAAMNEALKNEAEDLYRLALGEG